MGTKVRFAPSPTGNVHIGNIRTAIFNWLFARHTNGKFLLRVEDTDKERSNQDAINKMLDSMLWLGLDYDEDIYYQSKHEEEHKIAAQKLVNENKAYYKPVPDGKNSPIIFRIPVSDDTMNIREVGNVSIDIHSDVSICIDQTGIKYANVSKKGKPVEFNGCLAGFKDLKVYDNENKLVFELGNSFDEILKNNKSYSFENCSKISFLRREIFYNDLIKGELSKPLDSIKDLIIIRSDGSPVFHLANVCDDAAQSITHIIRGDDHVENSYRHILLFRALGYDVPEYAHMPMIVNKAGKPYSKRDGDAFVGDFNKNGYLADALFNYLSLLGWSPGDDREKMTKAEMIEAFTLDRVKSSPAQLDFNKLLSLNGLYMADLPHVSFLQSAYDEAVSQRWGNSIESTVLFEQVSNLFQSRTKLFSQVAEWKYFFVDDSPFFAAGAEIDDDSLCRMFDYDMKAVKKVFKKEELIQGLIIFKQKLDLVSGLDNEKVTSIIREAELDSQLEEGKLNQPLRIAVTGRTGGAGIDETLVLIGKERIVERLDYFLEAIKGLV